MSEEEKECIKLTIKYAYTHICDFEPEEAETIKKAEKAIETILDLYNKEKEENKELSEKLTEQICKNVEAEVFEEMRLELKQEKEKNEALENKNASLNKEIKLMKSVNINDNYISKDKIREFIKKETFEGTYSFDLISAKRLKELLEKE